MVSTLLSSSVELCQTDWLASWEREVFRVRAKSGDLSFRSLSKPRFRREDV